MDRAGTNIDALLAGLSKAGFDQVGIADGAPHDRVLPGCRSVVVVGHGGPALFAAFVDEADRWLDRDHPLDAFVRARIRAITPLGLGGRWVWCAADEALPVDFRGLALAAGLGYPSRLGLVLSPEVGPWLALRAVWFTDAAISPTGPRVGSAPCDACPGPCATACPGTAFRPAFTLGACMEHRAAGGCLTGCDARAACPIGASHRYPADQIRYHTDPVATRREWAATGGASGRRR
ncbi:MAG: hypothetical protein ABMB14_28110 [Myxococcota bacterium]